MLNCKECDCSKECNARSEYNDIMQTCTDFRAFVNGIRADERAKVLEEIKTLIGVKLIDNLNLTNATKYGNENAKQQANSYATVMKYEIADCVDDLLEDLEQLKESK